MASVGEMKSGVSPGKRQYHVLDAQGRRPVNWNTEKIRPEPTGSCLVVAFGQEGLRDSMLRSL